MKIGLISLGCAKNLVDAEFMLGGLVNSGYEIESDPAKSDIIVINSCGFIESAKKESIDTILKMIQYKKKGHCKGLILTGCLGQRYASELFAEIPELDAILGTGTWDRLPRTVENVLAGKRFIDIEGHSILPDPKLPRVRTTAPHMAYVKIAEGCNHACAFCIIPQIRGPLVSRSIDSIELEVRDLIASGVREINLVAQDTTSYGIDLYGKPSLVELLKCLCQLDGDFWIRILYSYPKNFSVELIELVASQAKICNYVDIPLQHVHDDVLAAMKRPDRRRDIDTLIQRLRTRIPDIAIRSTFIVGLPGETEVHYQELRSFLMEYKLDHVGIFVYSPEEGTVAATMPEQVSTELKLERYDDLMSIQAAISEEINQKAVGQEYRALVEAFDETDESLAQGRTFREAAEIDGLVYIESASGLQRGDFVKIQITSGYCYDRMAEIVSD